MGPGKREGPHLSFQCILWLFSTAFFVVVVMELCHLFWGVSFVATLRIPHCDGYMSALRQHFRFHIQGVTP